MHWWRWKCFIGKAAEGRMGCSSLCGLPGFAIVGPQICRETDEGHEGLVLSYSPLLHGGGASDSDGCFCYGEQELGNGGDMFHFGKRATWLPIARVEEARIEL